MLEAVSMFLVIGSLFARWDTPRRVVGSTEWTHEKEKVWIRGTFLERIAPTVGWAELG